MITEWTRPVGLALLVMGVTIVTGGDWGNALGGACFVMAGYVVGRTS